MFGERHFSMMCIFCFSLNCCPLILAFFRALSIWFEFQKFLNRFFPALPNQTHSRILRQSLSKEHHDLVDPGKLSLTGYVKVTQL